MADFKNCPFCGGDKIEIVTVRDGNRAHCRMCGAASGCEFYGPADKPSAYDRAQSFWNRRAAPSPDTGEVGELIAELTECAEMVSDGRQNGLTEFWHKEVASSTASACAMAAKALRAQAARIKELEVRAKNEEFRAGKLADMLQAEQLSHEASGKARDEWRSRAERAETERDEALQTPWPKWADEIRKSLENYGVDPGDDGWDLPDQLENWLAEAVKTKTKRAEKAEARLAQAVVHLESFSPLTDDGSPVRRFLNTIKEHGNAE